MTTTLIRKLENLMLLLLLTSPVLDLINGIRFYLLCGGSGGMVSNLDHADPSLLSPSLAVRLFCLAAMALYLVLQKQWNILWMFAAIGCSWMLTVGHAVLRDIPFHLMEDVQYIVRFCYSLTVLAAYLVLFQKQQGPVLRRQIDRICGISLTMLSLSILVPYLLNIGFYTYTDRLGCRGFRGFFYAGNDITVVMISLLPISAVAWMEAAPHIDRWAMLQGLAAAMCLLSMLIVGTKTCFVAMVVILIAVSGYSLLCGLRKKEWRLLRRLAQLLLLLFLLFLILHIVSPQNPLETVWRSLDTVNTYREDSSASAVIFSGRIDKLHVAVQDFKAALPLSALVGIGRGGQERIIEMDLAEVLLYYGGIGAVTMLWFYLWHGACIIRDLFRNITLRCWTISVSLALCVCYLTLAGHTLFSVTAGYYFSFLMVYARIFCSID